MTTYRFLPIARSFLLIYLISYSLTKTKYLKFTTHRRIWNLLLSLCFFVTGTIGISMAFINSFEFDFEIPYIILQIYVGFGIVWFIGAFNHFLWHRTYFKKAIKVLFAKTE